jgi:hypothetical protein
MSGFTIHAELDGTQYTAERESNGEPFYVRESDSSQILFTIDKPVTATVLRAYLEAFEAGRALGFGKGSIFGADQVRREFQKVLGVDLIGDALAELTAAVRELSGVRR